MCTCVDSVHVAVRGQLEGAGSLFVPCGIRGPNSGCCFTTSASSFGSMSLAYKWKSLTLYFPQSCIPLSAQRMSVWWGCYFLPWDSDKQGFKVISLVSGMSYPEMYQKIEKQVSDNMLGMWVLM